MRNRKIVIHAAVAAAIATFLAASSSEAAPKWRPGDKSAEDCILEGRHECPEDSLTCFCCFDNGCWICNDELEDCVWDPAARAQKLHVTPKVFNQTLSPDDGGTKKPRLPKVWGKPGTLAPAQ